MFGIKENTNILIVSTNANLQRRLKPDMGIKPHPERVVSTNANLQRRLKPGEISPQTIINLKGLN